MRQLARHLPAAFMVATAAMVLCGGSSARGQGGFTSHLFAPVPMPVWAPYAYGDQGPPPPITPALWRTFLALVATYEKFGANIPVSFAQWIVMNGVTDVREQMCLLWLWWNWTHQQAVD